MNLTKQLQNKTKEELLELMHADVAALAVEGAASLKKFKNAGCILFINMGIKIDKILSRDMISDIDGEVTKLALFWGFDNPQRLYDWRTTALAFCPVINDKESGAARYDTTRIKQLMADGGFEFEHFKHLARVGNSKKRNALIKQTVKNGWSANDLSREIAGSGVQPKHVRGGGRPPQIPTTAAQFISKSYRDAQKLSNFFEAAQPSVSELFSKIPTDKADEGFIERIADARQQCQAAAAAAMAMDEELSLAQEHVEQVIANTVEAGEKE